MLNEFITFEILSSFPGMVLVVSLLTQLTKGLIDRLIRHHTGVLVVIYSILLVFFVSYAKGEFTGDLKSILVQLVMNVLNGLVVSLAAMKGYEKTVESSYAKKLMARRGKRP
ncbi:MAG: hypothetical protein ACOX6S_10315 [Clostridia bacterium]